MGTPSTHRDRVRIWGGVLGGIAYCLVMLALGSGFAAVAGGLVFALTWAAVAAIVPRLRRRGVAVRRQREGYFGRDDAQ